MRAGDQSRLAMFGNPTSQTPFKRIRKTLSGTFEDLAVVGRRALSQHASLIEDDDAPAESTDLLHCQP